MTLSRTLLAAVALYLGLRLAVLFLGFDAVAIPAYELTAVGNIAKIESVAGDACPLDLHYDNCGARLVVGLVGAGLFSVFGDSYLTLKMVPLLFGLVALVLLWTLLDRHFDRRTADLAAVLFATIPPTLVKFSVLAMGSHFECLPFLFAVWLAFLEAHERRCSRRSLVICGALAGFSVFVYFGSFLFLAALLVQHCVTRGPRQSARDAVPTLAGFLVGAVPLFWIYARTNGRPLAFAREQFGAAESAPAATRSFTEFFTNVLPNSSTFDGIGPLSATALGAALILAYIVAWLVAGARLRRAEASAARRWNILPVLLSFPLFLFVLAVSNFDFSAYGPFTEVGRYRYLVPQFAFASVLLAWAATQLGDKVRTASAIAAVLIGATSTWATVEKSGGGRGGAYAGHAMQAHARSVMRDVERDDETGRIVLDPETWLARTKLLPSPMCHDTLFGLGYLIALDAAASGVALTENDLRSIQRAFPRLHRTAVARGLGSQLRLQTSGSRAHVRESLDKLAATNLQQARAVAHGLPLLFRSPLGRDTEMILAHLESATQSAPASLKPHVIRGLGHQVGRMWRVGPPIRGDVIDGWIDEMRLRESADFWFGVGCSYAETETPPPASHRRAFAAGSVAEFWKGYGFELSTRHGPNGLRALWPALRRDRSADQRAWIATGAQLARPTRTAPPARPPSGTNDP